MNYPEQLKMTPKSMNKYQAHKPDALKSEGVPPVGMPPKSKVGLGGDKPVPPVTTRPKSKVGLGM